MSTDVEKLEDLYEQLQNARALLPQMLRKLAFASEDQSSSEVFKGVARDLMAWKASSETLESNYNGLKPLLTELNGTTSQIGADSKPDSNGGTIDLTAAT